MEVITFRVIVLAGVTPWMAIQLKKKKKTLCNFHSSHCTWPELDRGGGLDSGIINNNGNCVPELSSSFPSHLQWLVFRKLVQLYGHCIVIVFIITDGHY